MKTVRVLVSTSVFEGQPNAVLEAMACGCPLVVSDIAAHREFLDDETAAIVPLAREPFVAALREVLCRPERTASRAMAARRAVAELSLTRAVEAHRAVYREVVWRQNECVE
jgi:glycosyltransferase involved in cell wall biosynthesis